MNDCNGPKVLQGRSYGRSAAHLRPIRVIYDAFGYAPGAVLFEIGNTKVLCTASLQIGVPPFLKGSRTGWLSAEYAMLPTATVERSQRESTTHKRSGRSMEISRLIGRSLRVVTKLENLGERTILIDCDVLQADGGTRTASISGAFLALKLAEKRWLENKVINQAFIFGDVAAISAGIVGGQILVDLDCAEDNAADVDFNFVLNSAGNIIEIQGSVEGGGPIAWDQFELMRTLAVQGVKDLYAAIPNMEMLDKNSESLPHQKQQREDRAPLFSLKNRLNKTL
jgi:ribonuclease PH